MPPIKAIIFDFDGLIVDTETPEYQSWDTIYQEYGHTMPMDLWMTILGGDSGSTFDPCTHLQTLTNQNLDCERLRARRSQLSLQMIYEQPILPGVLEYLDAAQALGLRIGLASSSPHSWVDSHLTRLGLFNRFEVVLCRDDVARPKPAPDLFKGVMDFFGVQPSETVVLEDSPNGITAARAAGAYVVGVPNPISRQLNISHATLVLNSLAHLSLESLLARLNGIS